VLILEIRVSRECLIGIQRRSKLMAIFTIMKSLPVLFVGLVAVFLSGCGSLPAQYSASPNRSLVKGLYKAEPVKKETVSHLMLGMLDPNDHTPVIPQKSTWTTHVQINSVDGGDVLWVRGYHIGDKVWLEPGVHKLIVMCTTEYFWGSVMVGTPIEVNVQAGYNYFLTLQNPLRSVNDKPKVDISKEQIK
jgi:hypothetical protein